MLDKSLPWQTLVQSAISYGTSVHPVRRAYLLGRKFGAIFYSKFYAWREIMLS